MKKWLCLILTACMVLAMTACSSSSQEEAATEETPKSEQTGTAGSNIALKDDPEQAVAQLETALKAMLNESYGDKIDDIKIHDAKIYTAEEEQANPALKEYNLGPDEVAFEVQYDLHPTEGTDVNELLPANGEFDEASGWVVNKSGLGILRPAEDGTYKITDFGTGW